METGSFTMRNKSGEAAAGSLLGASIILDG